MSENLTGQLEALIERLRRADWKGRDAVKEAILAFARANPAPEVKEGLEASLKDLKLELRWEIEEVLEALKPPPAPSETPEEPEAAPADDGKIRMSDLKVVYEDPRGLVLFTHKTNHRWFIQQPDPYSGQSYLQEIPPDQIEAVKTQLKGSPYWRLGSGLIA